MRQSGPPVAQRTLVIDADLQHGSWLVEQLNQAGFRADLATGWPAARALLTAGSSYQSAILMADLSQRLHREEIEKLRRQRPSLWLIALSHLPIDRAAPLARAAGVDAVLAEPFSMQDLTARLTALAAHPRATS